MMECVLGSPTLEFQNKLLTLDISLLKEPWAQSEYRVKTYIHLSLFPNPN
jgi:hypothetical protein